MKVALVISYQGHAFSGWQIQGKGIRTVQGELESAIVTYLNSICSRTKFDRVVLTGSGRTDSGVHAKGQVASFSWPESIEFRANDLLRALNGITPPEVAIHKVESHSDEFDARFSPHRKRYSYRLEHGRSPSPLFRSVSWCLPKKLDVEKMILASRHLLGTHDFAGFRAIDCSAKTSVRTVVKSELELVSSGQLLYIIEGKGFLKNMVRILVGTLVEIGQGKRDVDALMQILKSLDRKDAGQTAPAQGLCLEHVVYLDKV